MDRSQRLTVLEPEQSKLRISCDLATQPTFVDRVRAAAVKTAIAVASERSAVENHVRRVQLATQVLMSPGRWAEIMAEGVAANPSIVSKAMGGEAIPDDDLEFTVSSLWNAYAGQDGDAV